MEYPESIPSFFKNLFSWQDFMPHGHCYLWRSDIVWLQVLSNASIALAYYSIPLALLYFVIKKKDFPFWWIFIMFGIFIMACGTTHVMDIITIWRPIYRLDGVIDAFTAVVSVVTAIVLWPLIPKVLNLPSNEKLIKANEQILREMNSRKKQEEMFRGLLESAPDAMVIVDKTGSILLVNSQAEKLFGYTKEQITGQKVEILMPERFRAQHPGHRGGFFANPRSRPMGTGLDLWGIGKDGSEFPIEISLSPLETEEGMLVTAAIRDITERKKAEKIIVDSLKEKEVLLKEVHHRVKNNLQIIASLLNLQSKNIKDDKIALLFRESQSRVQSMALIHEKLYQSKNLSQVDFSEYLKSLATELFRIYPIDFDRITLNLNINASKLEIDTAIPLGLIINELLSNALKYAFPGGTTGEIYIHLFPVPESENKYSLVMGDTGVGFPKDFNLDSTETLGLQIVKTLSSQIRGVLHLNQREKGVEYQLQFTS